MVSPYLLDERTFWIARKIRPLVKVLFFKLKYVPSISPIRSRGERLSLDCKSIGYTRNFAWTFNVVHGLIGERQ